MSPLFSDIVVAATITALLGFASVVVPLYLKNKRSLRKISAEEYIDNFMKRQMEEIAYKDTLLTARDITIKELEKKVDRWSKKAYKYETMVKELKHLLKQLRAENTAEKKQNNAMRIELLNLKSNYETMYNKKFVQAVKDGKLFNEEEA